MFFFFVILNCGKYLPMYTLLYVHNMYVGICTYIHNYIHMCRFRLKSQNSWLFDLLCGGIGVSVKTDSIISDDMIFWEPFPKSSALGITPWSLINTAWSLESDRLFSVSGLNMISVVSENRSHGNVSVWERKSVEWRCRCSWHRWLPACRQCRLLRAGFQTNCRAANKGT